MKNYVNESPKRTDNTQNTHKSVEVDREESINVLKANPLKMLPITEPVSYKIIESKNQSQLDRQKVITNEFELAVLEQPCDDQTPKKLQSLNNKKQKPVKNIVLNQQESLEFRVEEEVFVDYPNQNLTVEQRQKGVPINGPEENVSTLYNVESSEVTQLMTQ